MGKSMNLEQYIAIGGYELNVGDNVADLKVQIQINDTFIYAKNEKSEEIMVCIVGCSDVFYVDVNLPLLLEMHAKGLNCQCVYDEDYQEELAELITDYIPNGTSAIAAACKYIGADPTIAPSLFHEGVLSEKEIAKAILEDGDIDMDIAIHLIIDFLTFVV